MNDTTKKWFIENSLNIKNENNYRNTNFFIKWINYEVSGHHFIN